MFSGGNFIAHLIQIKLALLAATAIVAVHTRRRVLPTLSVATLPRMARRIRLITTLAVLFVVTGVSFRVGPWF